MINIEEEWAFINHEVHYNQPKVTPYKGKDLIIHELLFILQNLLSFYEKDKSVFNLTVYELSKKQHLKLIFQENNN